MGQYDGELAALRHQRSMEALEESPITDKILGGSIALAGMAGLPFEGLIRRAMKSGQIPVERMIDNLELAAYEEVQRIWKYLEGKEKLQKEFAARLQSQEAESAYLSAIFHGLRTSDPQKQMRLGRLTINCIFADDSKPEVLDDMMRAAAELSEPDISLLKDLYQRPSPTDMNESDKGRTDFAERMGSVAKLQAVAFVQLRTPGTDLGANIVVLLPKGRKFYQRLQGIGTAK